MAFINIQFKEKKVKLRETSVTTRNLALVFKLEMSSVYLISKEDEIVVADERGLFNVNAATDYILQGDDIRNNQPSSDSTVNIRPRINPPPAGLASRPTFRTITTGPSTSTTASSSPKTWRKSFLHVEADSYGKISEKFQLHLCLSEDTANIPKIKEMIQEQLGYEVELLDTKNLPIMASDLTKGKLIYSL